MANSKDDQGGLGINLLRFKPVMFGAAFYFLSSNLIFAVVLHLSIPQGLSEPESIKQWADADEMLIRWQEWIGTVFFLFGAYICAMFSLRCESLRNCLLLGFLFACYGMIGIVLHPNHSFLMQVGKVLVPLPLAGIAFYLHLVSSGLRK